MLTQLHNDPRLRKLDKSSQDLVLAFAEALERRGSPAGGPSARLTRQAERWRLRKATAGEMHISTELTDMSIAYFQDQGAFVAAGRGIKSVAQKSDSYLLYDKGDLLRDEAQERAENTEAAGGDFKVTSATYACKRFAFKKPVSDELVANQTVGDPRLDALAFVTQKMLIKREVLWMDALFKTGLWTTDLDGVAGAPGANQFQQWDQSASVPRKDLQTQSIAIHERSGNWPNTFTLTPKVLAALLRHADITDAFKHTTSGAVPTMEALARALFSLVEDRFTPPMVTVASGVKATSAEGATDAFAYIGGKHALLAYVLPTPALRLPTAYAVFSWENAVFGTNALGVRIRDYVREETASPNVIEGEIFVDIKLVAADLGAFFESAVA